MIERRGFLAGGVGAALGGVPQAAGATVADEPGAAGRRMISAADFGASGDGVADDTRALQAALDRAFAPNGPAFLVIPPGRYRVTRTLRVALASDLGRRTGIIAHGARLTSEIGENANVLEIASRATVRFVLIEGLDILGSGREGHGLYLECDHPDKYLYNFCLRDVVVQGCGGDGCRLVGNVFEGQIVNAYFRGNKGNGATFAHGRHGGILSSIHVFGCVLGDNGANGAALVNGCYDVSFHGCYLLLNSKFGLLAENGCTLLSNCGFENNHAAASGFAGGDAGVFLNSFGTLIGCTGYSVFNQTKLLRAYVSKRLVMTGCTGSGGGGAAGAGLATIGGIGSAGAVLIGCSGAVDYRGGFEAIELGGSGGGIRLGSDWRSRDLVQLGEYRLWVDQGGRLRLKKGAPSADEDGKVVGA